MVGSGYSGYPRIKCLSYWVHCFAKINCKGRLLIRFFLRYLLACWEQRLMGKQVYACTQKEKKKKFPVEIKWLNSAWVAYQIKTSPAPLAYSSTPSSYVLWLPCCSSEITEGTLFCLQASWSSTQKGESPETQSYCLKRWDTGWDDGLASSHRLNYTVLHFSSLTVLPCIKAVHSLILS